MPAAIEPQNLGITSKSTAENVAPDQLRRFSRSPHPYHRQQSEIHSHTEHSRQYTRAGSQWSTLSPTQVSGGGETEQQSVTRLGVGFGIRHTGSKSPSDSGTEADDEGNGILKGLPAPPQRARKGLREAGGLLLDTSTPYSSLTPSCLDGNRRTVSPVDSKGQRSSAQGRHDTSEEAVKARDIFTRRRKAEIIRRSAEVLLLGIVGYIIYSGVGVSQAASRWRNELLLHGVVVLCLYLLYPLRLLNASHISATPGSNVQFPIQIPSSFDPAPLLYPVLLPVYIALALSATELSTILPNLILSLSSIPSPFIPLFDQTQTYSVVHWMLTAIPLILSKNTSLISGIKRFSPSSSRAAVPNELNTELLLLLYPLHRTLLANLQYLTTTSLLPTELQLLSTSLINILLHSTSPQGKILESLLWLGGLAMLIFCRHVLGWAVSLARIPSWRFRRIAHKIRIRNIFLEALEDSIGKQLSGFGFLGPKTLSSDTDSDREGLVLQGSRRMTGKLVTRLSELGRSNAKYTEAGSMSAIDENRGSQFAKSHLVNSIQSGQYTPKRRHTLSTFDGPLSSPRLTTSGSSRRPRRPVPSSLNPFLSLTSAQATMRKWLYAIYTYAAVICIIAVGIRSHVSREALAGHEPIGWALGYLLGDLHIFRLWVLQSHLERWIPLPSRVAGDTTRSCQFGWVEDLRQDILGAANTRLLICMYCLLVITVGLAVVLRLSSVVEVDTRRKVFHGMMVAMFLPATFVDPTFVSLALALILAIFLLLDLFRASQLPPLSKPLTHFLAPYVDGRDHRGPVVVSHIFLLIGCAIPLWLSLAGIERTGQAPWQGWEVSRREVSMVSGVICVGLGDAAASLIGRRFGRRKWPWSGGKSLEGSFAFAAAVTLGLVLAKAWLRIGGWSGGDTDRWFATLVKATIAATGASLTEAILTGGNDNVVVPVILWLLTKGLGI